MDAVDPTYPLLPIAYFLSAMMLLVVLLTSFMRRHWNLGVTFLCFSLFIESVTGGANSIIWSDNSEIKLLVYCDIVSRVQMIAFVVKPMATLIISRRLYLVASLQSVELPDAAMRRRNWLIEWTLGLAIPVLVAGPIYYTVQVSRFQVVEGFGCANASALSVFVIVAIEFWGIIPPAISIAVYYPRVVRIFYLHSRDVDHFLGSNGSISRTNYLRILALASLDILLTLPIGIVNIVLYVTSGEATNSLQFYPGWDLVHSNWEPRAISYAELQALGVSTLASQYFSFWTTPVLSFTIFGLFGMTTEARASYWNVICAVGSWLGWKPSLRTGNVVASLGTIEFNARPEETMELDAETGSHPSFIDTNVAHSTRLPTERGAGNPRGSTSREPDLGEVYEHELDSEHHEERNVPNEQDRRSKSSSTNTTTAPVEA